RHRLLDPRHGVADPDLDRPEPRVQADVPPDVRVVRDAARLLELADGLRVLGVVVEARRGGRAREGGEHHLAARREARRLAAPEGGVRRQGEEERDVEEQAVDDLDRLLRVVHRDVDVHAEDELAARHVLHLVDEVPVAVARGDPLALEERERVCPGRADAHPPLARELADVTAELPELGLDVGGGAADRSRDLEHRLHQLGVDPGLELVGGQRREHRVDVLDEVEGLGVEEHVLLLHAQRVRVALAERVVEHAPAGGEALARDRRGVDLLHDGSIASASISTNQRGSRSSATIPVQAGRAWSKTSPWARITSGTKLRSVTKMRVRTTSCGDAPASARASTTISRHRRACAYGSAGGSSSPGMIGAVPLTWTCPSATTARE